LRSSRESNVCAALSLNAIASLLKLGDQLLELFAYVGWPRCQRTWRCAARFNGGDVAGGSWRTIVQMRYCPG
jgi:hypothetical protein